MPTNPRLFSCPACGRTRVTQVRGNLCFSCYDRQRPRERKLLATCLGCGRTRWAYYRCGLCPGCYEQRRRRSFVCTTCHTRVEAGASFAAKQTCPRCFFRARHTTFRCPACERWQTGRPDRGLCRNCASKSRQRLATCRECGQRRRTTYSRDGLCQACRSTDARRSQGIPKAQPPSSPEATERRLLEGMAPLRRAWLREFLESAYRARLPETRYRLLGALAGFDRYLAHATLVGGGQWTLITADDLLGYLASVGPYRLEPARAFFQWLFRRKGGEALAKVLPHRHRTLRLRLLPAHELALLYRHYTSGTDDPRAALVGLLAMVHCCTTSDIRHLRLDDAAEPGRLVTPRGTVVLAPPVQAALDRYLAWRQEAYGGPSSYLLVSRASRLHDRPVSATWFQDSLLGGIAVSTLRQSAIHLMITKLRRDGIELAASTRLSVHRVGAYLMVFGTPAVPE